MTNTPPAKLRLAHVLLAIGTGCRRGDPHGRVIVLGLDGMAPDVVERLIADGSLPHFRQLRDGGASGAGVVAPCPQRLFDKEPPSRSIAPPGHTPLRLTGAPGRSCTVLPC